jgi:predicted nucleotidyltransferase
MDTERLLRLLKENRVVFIVIGASAFPAYGYARATLDFEDVWKGRIKAKFGSTEVYFPSLDDMIKMKQAAGRAKDREDLKYLRKLRAKQKEHGRRC